MEIKVKNGPDYFEQIVKILRLVTVKGQECQQNKPQIFNEILKLMKNIVDLKETGQNQLYLQYIKKFLADESIILWFRNYLNDPKISIRYNTIKFLRYLIEDKNTLIIYRQRGIQFFIARSLERDVRPERQPQNSQQSQKHHQVQEVLQALKFVHRWLEVNQVKFPKVLGNALVSFAESCEDSLRKYAILTLRLFALNQPDICGWCGGVKSLIEFAVDPSVQDMSDQIVWSLLYLLNEPNTRAVIRVYLDFSRWFSIFTEIDPPIDQKQDKQKVQQTRFEQKLQLSKKALISVLKSWQGLIYLGNEQLALKSLVEALRQPIKQVIRGAIYDILKELLALGSVENTGVSVAHRWNEPTRGAGGEYKINNLLNNYLVMLVQVLLDCGLFKVLVELSGLEDVEVALPAQRFLRELSALMFNLIPDYHKYTDFLIAAANQNDQFLMDLKSWSSEIVNTMGNYAFDQDKKKKTQVSKFIYQTENLYQTMQLGLPSHKINNETVNIIRAQIEQEVDEARFQTLLKTSQVTQAKEDSSRWNWDSILELLETFLANNIARFQDAIKNKFLKTLLGYFFPSNLLFVFLDWRPENFIQAKCGYLLLKLLAKEQKGRDLLMLTGESLLKINKTFFQDLKALLSADIQALQMQSPHRNSVPQISLSFVEGSPIQAVESSMLHSAQFHRESQVHIAQSSVRKSNHPSQSLLNADSYQTHMIREYMSWVGVLSSFKKGLNRLIQDGIYNIFMQWVDKNGCRDHILSQLIHSFDYGKPGPSRDFLQFCLQNGSRNLVRACLDFLRLLYRTELQDYSQWAIELLIQAIKSDDESNAIQALSVAEEVTQEAVNMSTFIERVNLSRLLVLANNAQSSFVIRALSHTRGLERVLREQPEFLLAELERWKEEESLNYIERVEKVMCDALQFVQSEDANAALFRFPSLLTAHENSHSAVQFIYKMPWLMYVDYECADTKEQVYIPLTVDVEGVYNNKLKLCGRPYYSSESLLEQTIMGINSTFMIKMHMAVGGVLIDANCKATNEPYVVRCDSNNKKESQKGDQFIVERGGVTFIFEISQGNQKMRLFQINVSMRMGETKNIRKKMPPHIFGELAYTERGFALLQEYNYIDYFIDLLLKDNVEPQNKRCALWAIGHIGQSKHGARYVRDRGLIPDLVKIAEQCPVLSLRGTCLYALNMICTTSTGRKELEKFGWISHLNSNLGWLCIPKNIYQFFYIRVQLKENQKTYWAFQDEIWEKYQFVQKHIKLNADQTKILETISLMSNQLTIKDAEREINKLRLQKPNAFESIDLFHSVLLMITFYKFKTPYKNKIYSYFDKMFTPSNIQQAIENPIYQKIGCQDGTII